MQEEELKSALTDEQILAVMHKDGPALVSACPGAGKTRVVMYRTAMLVSQGVNPAHICLVTFTNKAAEEMKSWRWLFVSHILKISGLQRKTAWNRCAL
jgi:superfamily I DNA/RNA helicase